MWAMTGDTGVPGCLIKPRREMEHLHAFTLTTLNLLGRFAGLEVKEAYKFSRQPVRRETTLVWVGTRGEHFRE